MRFKSIFKFKWCSIFWIVLLAGLTGGCLTGALLALLRDLPQIRGLENFKPSAITRIYSADKELLAEFFLEKRDPVPLNQIPKYLQSALIATEDRGFYDHSGVAIKSILRAVVKDIMAGKFVEGASTITQQLAKTLFLTPRKSLIRKIKEALLAIQLERRYTKKEILELYLNQVYFGSGAYGVQAAAKIFFNKNVQQLDLAQCALIAGMPKAPSFYSPLVNKQRAVKRRNLVLKQMCLTDIIDNFQYEQAKKALLQETKASRHQTKAPYFVDYIKKQLEKIVGPTLLYKGGLTVSTTLSFKLQKAAEFAINEGLANLDQRIKKKKNNFSDLQSTAQAALVALNVQTGEITAMVGGKNFSQNNFNRAVNAKRQPGSAFKPIIYANAVERGFAQTKMLLDGPVIFKNGPKGKQWRPKNFSGDYQGEITMRKALVDSINIPAIRLIENLGPAAVADFGHDLGIESSLASDLSLALGSSELSLMELVSAYAVFANKGEKITPFGILEISDAQGKLLWQIKPQRKLIMSRAGAAIITNMLEGVIQEGTGRRAKVLRPPVGGKTGTTNDFKDALFVGYSPGVAAGVWVGKDDHSSLGNGETGSKTALPIWINFMKQVQTKSSFQYFDLPDDVVKIRINPLSRVPIGETSADGVRALFLKGTEPKPLSSDF